MAIINSRESWPLRSQEADVKKGKLIRVEITPGRFVKMYEVDAVAQGLVKVAAPAPLRQAQDAAQRGEQKSRPPGGDKMVKPGGDKAAPPAPQRGEQEPPPDDLTTIPGVGKATARALAARGITTFEQLRQANALDFLTPQARESIEQWRNDATD